MTDSELVDASRRGEVDAFGHLVARYQHLVCAVSFSSTGDRNLSEDVAQDTFLAAWRDLDRMRDTMRFRPWLCGIARNLARKARKRKRRETPVDVDAHAGDGASPFELVARGDADRVVRDALFRVPDAYREVLVLYYRDDCSIREVADALGLSETAVMQRLSRGRRYLADNVTAIVERSLRDTRPRRDLVAAVLAAIAAFTVPSRVDASPTKAKGSTMLKLAAAASALAVVGTAAYLARSHDDARPPARTLHYGAGAAHPPTLATTTTPGAIAARTAATGDLPYLPADSDAVLGIDIAQLRGSSLWQQFVAPVLSNAEPIRQFQALCGFDPIESLKSVAIGLRGFGNDALFSGTVVLHGIDRTKAMTCFDAQGAARAQQNGVQVTIDGNVALFTAPDGYHAGFTFVDDTTAIAVLGPEAATKAGVAKIAAGGGGLDTANGFGTLFANVNATDSLWLVLTDGSPLLATINSEIAAYTTIQLHGTYGSLGVTDSLTVHGGIRLATPTLAEQIVADAQKQLDELAGQGASGKYFDQLDVVSDGNDVLVDVAMNLAQLLAFSSSGAVNVDVDVKSGS
jgi:RNA polymerase sigma factor (sigma-70 family)